LTLDKVLSFCSAEKKKEKEVDWLSEERVESRNPRWAVYGSGLEDVKEFLNSENYDPAAKKIGGNWYLQPVLVLFLLMLSTTYVIISRV
jgi:hypothetical protein